VFLSEPMTAIVGLGNKTLMALAPIDTRSFFRPLSADIVHLLRTLRAEDWERPTLAGSWRVRDVVAHLADTALRRLSFHRDGRRPSSSNDAEPVDLVALINGLNAEWVRTADRFSPSVLVDLYALAGQRLADFMETLDLDALAIFPVSWSGDTQSRQWFDIGREFTEVWHHGSQIRDAVGASPFEDVRWLRAVLDLAMHALPYTYRDVTPDDGRSLLIKTTGPAEGDWILHADGRRWDISEGSDGRPDATVTMTGETAWRLFFNALKPADAERLVEIDGDRTLALPLLRTRSVIV